MAGTNNSWNNQIAGSYNQIILNAGTNGVDISTDASATTVNIATGAAAKIVTLGSTNGASSLALKTGTADFSLASATGTIMSALDTGEITFPLQSAFLAYNSTTDTNATGGGGAVTVEFDTEVYDQNGDFNNTTDTFTAPVTGKYFFHGNVWFSNVLTATDTYLRIGTSNREYTFDYRNLFATSATNIGAIQGTTLADMDSGDTAIIQVTCSGQATTVSIIGSAAPQTFFCGKLSC